MIEKLKMQTPDMVVQNVKKLGEIFPEVVTEKEDTDGKIIKGIDFDLLKQKLSDVLVEDENERYRLDWPGKKASLLKANLPINKTLRPIIEDSVDFEITENLYIEGDNFEVLKILQESYLGKVKMIYIDPPYNTGGDFLYKDDYKKSNEEYEEEIGIFDDEGSKLFKNTDSNGRFHSDWLSMMYERLIIAYDLLKAEGIIFISIDDSELTNMKKICDEIFGEDNFIEAFIWIKKNNPPNNVVIGSVHEYILTYAKDKAEYDLMLLPRDEKVDEKYSNPDKDNRGPWTIGDLSAAAKGGRITNSLMYEIENPMTGEKYSPPPGRMWIVPKDRMLTNIKEGRIWWGKDGLGKPKYKRYLSEVRKGLSISTLLNDVGNNGTAAKELNELFDGKVIFETPKPVKLILRFLEISLRPSDVCLDFFSGSATTAHSVMELNATDSGNHKFILVQLNEKTDEQSDAYKAGYRTIADIGKERIRRAGKRIKHDYLNKYEKELNKVIEDLKQGSLNGNDDLEAKKIELESKIEHIKNLDIGFRVYKTDSSNMKDIYYHPTELKQEQMELLESNIKEDRTPEDLLTQVILDLGLELSLKIEKKEILGNSVFVVQENALVACFDDNINFGIVDKIAELNPFKVVFKDASFKDDKDRINVEERFKRLSPETVISVL